MLKKTGLILFAVMLAFSLVTCNNYDEIVTPIPVVGTAFSEEDWIALTEAMAGVYDGEGLNTAVAAHGNILRPAFTGVVKYNIQPGSITVSKRAREWNSVDLCFRTSTGGALAGMEIPAGINEVTVIVKATSTNGMWLQMPDTNSVLGTSAGGEQEYSATIPIQAGNRYSVRIRAGNASEDYTINSVVVKYGTPYDPLPPEPFTNNDEEAGVVFPGTF
jgi:hypothetical protein